MPDYYPEKLNAEEINKLALNMGISQSLISRDYLSRMEQAQIIGLSPSEMARPPQESIRLMRITALNYDRHESILEKLKSMFSALSMIRGRNIIMILNNRTDKESESLELYMGISGCRVEDMRDSYSILEQSVRGNFPGCISEQCFDDDIAAIMPELVYQASNAGCSVSSVSVDAVQRGNDENFVQGMEKFADAMRGHPYTLMLIASPVSGREISRTINYYRELYTEISQFRTLSVTWNDTKSEALTTTFGIQSGSSISHSKTLGTSKSHSHTDGISEGSSQQEYDFTGSLIETGTTLLGVAGSLMLGVPGISFAGSMLGRQIRDATGYTPKTSTNGKQTSDSETFQDSISEQSQEAEQHGQSVAVASNTGHNTGLSVQAVRENKHVSDMLKSLERQIARLSASMGQGAFHMAAYVISSDRIISETGAGLYRSLMTGNRPDIVSAVNTWNDSETFSMLQDYLVRGLHPRMSLMHEGIFSDLDLSVFVPCSEMPLHFFLPRKTLPGLPVSNYAEFARSMPCEIDRDALQIKIGNVYHLGVEEKNIISLSADTLCSHALISGSPGSGKSNLSYFMLKQLIEAKIHFLVVEPAKGEYSSVIGGYTSKDGEPVLCFSARGDNGESFSVNPFSFPNGITALEHMEALLSVLETCWPMYAAMTDIMKDAVILTYEEAGWDMANTGMPRSDEYHYPTFADLMDVLPRVIEQANYSKEVKDNYKGSLQVRVKSMVNGTNRRIFGKDCISCDELFSRNIILDISGIGSSENRALMMGILVIRLHEFRRAERIGGGINSKLRHVTLLEEAHNLLGRNQSDIHSEGRSIGRKSAELIVNAIAEMRSYGEGFIIVDQTPSKLDSSVAANTAVKISFNLQSSDDSMTMGRAMSLNDEQARDIPTLPQGVCVVRSRGWTAPVKVKTKHFAPSMYKPFQPHSKEGHNDSGRLCRELLSALVKGNASNIEKYIPYLDSNIKRDRLIIDALTILSSGRKLQGAKRTELYCEIFETSMWFYTPEADKLQEWDKYMRSQLGSRGLTEKPEQDSVIQTLLITQGKNISQELIREWRIQNNISGGA